MDYLIEHVLGSEYSMFYHPAWPADKLNPVCNIEQSLLTVNTELRRTGRILFDWPAFSQDEIARLLWVNWIHQRLNVEPIRKPILVHYDNGKFIVDCGDTRLMALNLLDNPPLVSLVSTSLLNDAAIYDGWERIYTNQDLIAASGFSNNAHISLRPSVDKTHAIEWLEIGDQTTSHHLHDVNQRTNMMRRYLDLQPIDFVFDIAWAKTAIDWNAYIK